MKGPPCIWIVVVAAMAAPGCVSLSPPAVRWLDDPLVFQPAKYPRGEWSPPGLEHEDAFFTSADGTKLHGWYCPCDKPRAVVLLLHGNAGNLTHRWHRLQMLQQDVHVTAMIVDYRGYGHSEGVPTERGVLDDARAARKWLAQRAGVKEQQIVLLGESLGGGVAVDLAARDGAAALILESTFTSIPDVAAHEMPYTPVRYLMRNRFDSLAKIGQYHGPLLLAHGDADELIPAAQSQRLFNAANEPKRRVTIPGAGHNWTPTPEYVQELDRFFEQLSSDRRSKMQ